MEVNVKGKHEKLVSTFPYSVLKLVVAIEECDPEIAMNSCMKKLVVNDRQKVNCKSN